MKGRPLSDYQMILTVDHAIFRFLSELLFHFLLVAYIKQFALFS